MKAEKLLVVYECDCCGVNMLDCPRKMLQGALYNSKGVWYEPKVMGDYCEDCLEFAQDDWDIHGTSGFVSERYDSFDEQQHRKEVGEIKRLRAQEVEK